MSNPVRSIEEFHQPPTKSDVLVVALFLPGAAVTWFAVTYGLLSSLVGTALCFVAFLLFLPAIYAAKSRLDRAREGARDAYWDYLAEVDRDPLIRAQQSPDLDEQSRKVIVGYLNEHHPGWSFEEGREDLSQSGAT